MLYSPKFCCECGEKIERPDRRFWSSRRFCELCETDFLLGEWVGKLAVVIGILFSASYLAGSLVPERSEKRSVENQTLSSALPSVSREQPAAKTISEIAAPEKIESADSANALRPLVSKPSPPISQNTVKQSAPVQVVYFCGAETKKGTPCTRRVKGGGRCWQHVGRDAMLPAEKLVASQ